MLELQLGSSHTPILYMLYTHIKKRQNNTSSTDHVPPTGNNIPECTVSKSMKQYYKNMYKHV